MLDHLRVTHIMGTHKNSESNKTRVLIVDDHMIVVEGIKKLVSEQPDFEVAGTASDGIEAVKKSKALKPDIVIMDIAMPNLDGIKATTEIKKSNDQIGVIIFTMYSDAAHAISLFKQGVSAYVLKDEPLSDLLMALKAVRDGGTYFSSVVNDFIRRHIERLEPGGGDKESEPKDGFELLSIRERELFPLLADGKSIKEIAQKLYISPKTVETHKYNIMEKLGVNSISELTKIALRKKMIKL
jgi:DNA-binding NarL/FixJ family response regulator